MMSPHDPYLREPPIDKWLDRATRTIAYLSLMLIGIDSLVAPHLLVVHRIMDTSYGMFVAIMLVVSAASCALATTFAKYQLELTAVRLVVGSLAVYTVFSFAGSELHGPTIAFVALTSLMFARSIVLNNIRKRARLVASVIKGD